MDGDSKVILLADAMVLIDLGYLSAVEGAALGKPICLVIGQISHETNTFSPIRTGLTEFSERGRHYGEEMFGIYAGTKTAVAGFMDAAKEIEEKTGREIVLIPIVAAGATPSGTVTRDAYENLLGALLKGIGQAKRDGGVDGVVLALHGAMVAEGISDAEGDILEKVRQAVGPSVPITSSLDLHGNISTKMVANADAFFGYNTNPHIDTYERTAEATRCAVDIINGRLKPTMALAKRATIEVDLGGKVVPEHGKPVHMKALVERVTDGAFRNTGPMATGLLVNVGPTALLGVGGVDIIVISQRSAPNDPEIFRHVGIDPTKRKILVVKSRGHFRAGYEPFAKEIVEVDCPGMASPNLKWFAYKNVPRPLWPLDV